MQENIPNNGMLGTKPPTITTPQIDPFEAPGGFPLPRLLQYIPRTAKLEAMDDHLKSRKGILNLLKHNLLVPQDEAPWK